MANRGMLDLSVLYVGDKPVSFIWGAARWPRSTIAKMGFDPALEKYSPGSVHLAELISGSIARGVSEIDFGHESGQYKSMWGKRRDQLFNIWYYPPGITSSIIRWWRRRRGKCASLHDARPKPRGV